MDRRTPVRDGNYIALPVAANIKIDAGHLVAINALGYAIPASDTVGLKVIGRCEDAISNGADAGIVKVNVCRKPIKLDNSANNPLGITNVGSTAYLENSETVASTSENKIPAGIVLEIEDDGVWIDPATAPLIAIASANEAGVAE